MPEPHTTHNDGAGEFHKATSQQPAVNILDELVLRHFHAVLRNGLDDDALLSAIMLTFAFSATSNGIDRECLGYQNKALQSIRQRMGSPDAAASEPTLAAILLLAGLEVRGARSDNTAPSLSPYNSMGPEY